MTRIRFWWIVLAAGLIAALSMGIRQGFGLYLEPMTNALDISRQAFGFAIALQNLIWGLCQPFAGMLADRFGAGRVLLFGGACYVAGLALAAVSTDAASLHVTLGVLIGIGLSGTTWPVVLGAVGRLVPDRERSMALGLVTAGGSLGMFVLIPTTQRLLAAYGWSYTLLLFAGAALLVPVLSRALRAPSRVHGASLSHELPLRKALADASGYRDYWLLNAGFFVCGFHVMFIATHLPAYLIDQGISSRIAAYALAMIGLANIAGSYLCGALGGRFSRRLLLSYLYLARAVVIGGFLVIPLTPLSAMVFAALIGLLWLGTVPLTSGLVGQMFGARYLSTLFGIVFLSHQLGTFLGAWVGGYVFDRTGSYDAVWIASIILGLLAAGLHLPIRESSYYPTVREPA